MGYDSDRVDEPIPDNMKCSICLSLYKAPTQLTCGHIFCFECMKEPVHRGDGQFQCPIDRRLCQMDPLSLFFNSAYSDLLIKCQWHRFGCDAKIAVGQEIPHERKCEFSGRIPKPCPAGCPYSGPLLLPDGTDHNCVHFMMQEMATSNAENARLQRRVVRLEQELKRRDLEKWQWQQEVIDHAHHIILEQTRGCHKYSGSGDA